jgi:DNA-binding CsgD family transcriptional regulator
MGGIPRTLHSSGFGSEVPLRRFQKKDEGRSLQLAPREVSILRLVCVGESSDKAIASVLGLAPWTVHKAVTSMLNELGCENRLQLLIWGLQHPDALETGLTRDLPHGRGCTCDAIYCRAMAAARLPGEEAA